MAARPGRAVLVGMCLAAAPCLADNAIDPDGYEPDDTHDQATPLILGEVQAGHSIHYETFHQNNPTEFDIDFAVLTLEAETTVLLETPDSFGYLGVLRKMPITLYDSRRTPVGTAAPVRVETLRASTFYVSVTGATVFLESGIVPWYGILARDAALPDRFEDDDAAETATYLPYAGDSQAHNFDSGEDEDWLVFLTEGESTSANAFRAIPIGGGPYPGVALFREGASGLESVAPSHTFEGRHQFAGEPGVLYYARITNPDGDRAPEETYYNVDVAANVYIAGAPAPGTIAGTVTSGSALVEGADIRVESLARTLAASNGYGVYFVPNLPSATYTLSVEKAGYHPASAAIGVANGAIAVHHFDLDRILPEDLNGDFAVDAADVQLVINAVLGLVVSIAADVDGNAQTNAADIQAVINAALGL